MVDYYGSRTQLSHLGQISAPEARLVTVQVFDAGAVSAVEKAIQTSGLGLNPSVEGTLVRINIPTLTEEGRREIVKYLNKIAEDIKISIRNHRRDSNDIVKAQEKDSSLSKDDAKKVLEKIQTQTDKRIAEVDILLKAKEAECLEV
jgi:ribosome recycling factor